MCSCLLIILIWAHGSAWTIYLHIAEFELHEELRTSFWATQDNLINLLVHPQSLPPSPTLPSLQLLRVCSYPNVKSHLTIASGLACMCDPKNGSHIDIYNRFQVNTNLCVLCVSFFFFNALIWLELRLSFFFCFCFSLFFSTVTSWWFSFYEIWKQSNSSTWFCISGNNFFIRYFLLVFFLQSHGY